MDVLLEGGSSLQDRDYTVIIDQSQSMSIVDRFEQKPRWEMIQESTLALTTLCEHFDPDGITVYLFSDQFQRYEKVTSQRVAQIFKHHKPGGKANLAAVLKDATDNYFERRAMEISKPNGELILVVTGGEIEGAEAVKQIVINAANQLSRDEELGIEFIQVGEDAAVTRFFKVLDRELQMAGAKYDICNTVTFEDMEEMSLSEILLRAIAN
ncbi:VWA domain-containing protein [Capilliphycus salinus ALCB114379]|uniref:VWA domain-containing protein n=1 Tax=Capilliphycus salinus TaxID=2768948 RepID=UPI0039A58D31